MKRARLLVPALSLAMFCAVPAFAATPARAAAAAPAADAEARLRALYEAEWKWRQAEYANVREDDRWVPGDRLPSVTAETYARRGQYWEKALRELDAIPLEALPNEERINAEVFRTSLEANLARVRYRTYEAPFNSDTFFWGGLNPRQPYRSEAQYRRLLARLRDVPRYFDENIANMRAGLARGYSVPRSSVEGRDRTIEPYVADGASNPFLATFAAIPSDIPAAARASLQAEAAQVVREQVAPAYARLLKFMREEYLPGTRTGIAARDLPDGEAFYRAQIREFATLDMDPKAIHELGLKHVERIDKEMHEVMARAGFNGSFAQFLKFLRTDPQFYATTPHQLIAEASYIAKKVDGQLKHTIGTLPRYRFTILPVPDDVAPIYTSGRGGLESCLVNTYDLPMRPLYGLPSLVLHECNPGHSFQAAVALEAPERPEFRQQTYFSGYGEGWALYTEWLGTLMGIYETPYQDFGRLTWEMWRAARLVIDTGLHEYGWTRQQAIDYLTEHTALAQSDIVTEVDRYIAWPGQALAYYLGYLTIRDLRSEAERELGAAFDQRPFHDALLNLGSVPLPVMQEQMRRFVAEQKRKAGAAK